MPFKALFAGPGEKPVELRTPGDLRAAVREGKGCLWVDFEAPTEEDRRILQETFSFHRLALETCFGEIHHPRLHDYGDYVYLVIHALSKAEVKADAPPASDDDPPARRPGVATEEIDIFLGARCLVTWHRGPLAPVESVRRRALAIQSLMERGPDRVLAELLDEVADGYVDVVERLNDAIDGLETRLFRRTTGAPALREIFGLKKDVVHLRRIAGPQREVLNRLARGEFPVISPDEALFFRDVYDHVYRTTEMLE